MRGENKITKESRSRTSPIVNGDEHKIVIQQELGPVIFRVASTGDPSAIVEPNHDRITIEDER